MTASDFDFDLPPQQIAERPATVRDASRLMTLERASGATGHHRFTDLPTLLSPGDLLVLNDTRVFPARIGATKTGTGGRVELLLMAADPGGEWGAIGKGRLREGDTLTLDGGLDGHITGVEGDGFYRVRFTCSPAEVTGHLERHGILPLPPYIRRPADATDRERYQTVFAANTGSVAAPTSGLHFTDAVLAALGERGIQTCRVTLHVGPGTFLPMRVERIEDHRMHAERFVIPPQAAEAVRQTRQRGGRVIACGTTVTRALETAASEGGTLEPMEGESRLFIRPGYRFRVIDGLVTNFHLPRSTLLMLVSALVSREAVLAAYAEAVREGYRFFSYGDAMLIR
ncbi:MAG: tRNA preQ1(34) S-adenosylmethionine ribosyltransferase-isomerase QueA [Nitrospirota bacterium]|nr:tRNA preQ1(34) S-adenosylmethionine ribosyltransferase-isomerase QueA [Nitrospirota bacterium]